jgi:large subunit ribosomal protein L5
MATKTKGGNAPGNKKAPAKGGAAKGGAAAKGGGKAKGAEGGGGKRASMLPTEHAGVGQSAPAPRLREAYVSRVRPALAQRFGLTNPHQIPNLTKIVLNVGFGEAIKQPRLLDIIVEELAIISGQQPVRKKAKKSIANYALREGQEIGVAVTLRGAKMWEFMDRFVSTAIPRIRDFKGLSTRSFDGRGNYSMGIKEQMIFPEINYDLVEQIHGMDITFVTTTTKDDQALALLRELGMPFRGDDKSGARLTA